MKFFYNDIYIPCENCEESWVKETENFKISKESYQTKRGVIGTKRWYVSGMVPLQTIRIQL